MSKLSFRARALDASKPMPIYLAEDLPDLPEYSAINRAVPQMPSGMEKEEECEHHLQRAICAGLIIPTPEVMDLPDPDVYDRLYPPEFKIPKQLIHMQPLGLEQDVPDYDMDSEDERWLKKQQLAAGSRKCDLTELKFEETMERLERSSGQTVVTLREAKALAGKNGPAEHLLAAVYDYWLNKRLAVQQPLLLSVRTEARPGAPSPYLAFRRRTEKMQTRKNRKNDESSYEKMVKLRRGLFQAVGLLDMMRQREKTKKDLLKMTILIVEKRYQARDFSGHLVAEVAAQRVPVPPPILVQPYTTPLAHRPTGDSVARQREKRQYKRRKHLHHSSTAQPHSLHGVSGSSSSSEGETTEAVPAPDPSGPFAFRRKPGCHYYMPTASFGPSDEEPWRIGCAKENASPGDPNQRLRYSLTSLRHPTSRFIGLARRRLGRGGRVILDRLSSLDKLWESLDYTITDSHSPTLNNHSKIITNDKNGDIGSVLDVVKSQENGASNKVLPGDNLKVLQVSESVNSSEPSSLWCFADVKVKCEPEDMTSELPQNEQKIIKMEVDDCESNETLNNYLTGCVSVISDNIKIGSSSIDNNTSTRHRGMIPNKAADICWSGNTNIGTGSTTNICDAECKRVTEMLVQRGLKRHTTWDSSKTAEEIDEIFTEFVHFRPSSPRDGSYLHQGESQLPSEDLSSQLTDAQISVQVLPPLADDVESSLFHDTSLYSTSEFTLSGLYSDSLLPDSCTFLDSKNDWSHSNGPEKLDVADSVSETSKSNSRMKDTILRDSSSSNHTSLLTPSDGRPNSLISCDESNHAVSTTNGLEWSNDSNLSEKVIKVDKVIPEDVKLRDKRSVFTVPSLDNEKQIFLASDKNYRPVSPPQATPAPQQGIYIPISTGQAIKKKTDGQGMAVVQVRAPSMVRQMIGRVGVDSIGRPPLLVAQQVKTLPGGHKVVQGQKVVQQNQKVVQPVQKMIQSGSNAVTKLVQQHLGRKLQSDPSWRLSEDQIIVSGGGGSLPPTQQMVTVAVTEPLKFRLQGHLLTSTPRDGIVQPSGRRTAVVQLSPSGAVSGAAGVQGVGVGGSQVKVVRTLTPAQRSRLLQAAGANLRDLSGVLQLQMQARPNTSFNSEPVEVRSAQMNDTATSSPVVNNAAPVPQGNVNSNSGGAGVVVNTGQSSTQPSTTSTPGGQQRKSPMEVT